MTATMTARGRFEPLTDLSALPTEVLENFLTIVSERDRDEHPDVAFMHRLKAIIRKHEEGWEFIAAWRDVEAELLRRNGEPVPMELHQVYDWNGVWMEIKAISREWVRIRCTDDAGRTWGKRQPLPLPEGSKLIGWMR